MFPLSSAQRAVVDVLRPNAGGADAAWRQTRIDWHKALSYANAHYLVPALYSSLRKAGYLTDLPPDVRDYLALLHRSNSVRNGRLAAQARELVTGLNEGGIRPMLLKGGLALVDNHYDDPAERMLSDLDVLIPVGSIESALRSLDALGYAVLTLSLPGDHAYANFGRDGDAGAVDLHVELIDAHYLLGAREVWQRARPVSWEGAHLFLPSATDALLHNLLHAQVHYLGGYYRGEIELRQLYDFVAIARHGGGDVDWRFITERLTLHRLLIPLQSYVLAANCLFGLPWPFEQRPRWRARMHFRRCLIQQRLPRLAQANVPWANLRNDFARHRMDRLYEPRHPLVLRWLQHALGTLQKGGLRLAVDRLIRTR